MTKQEAKDKLAWCNELKAGDVVCDCRGKHLKISEVGGLDYDTEVTLEDGHICSGFYCLSPADDHQELDHVQKTL
jgi:hypothetical protein